MTPEMKYAKSGDIHIAYQVLGQGPIDLIFIPGWVTHVELAWENPYESFGNLASRRKSSPAPRETPARG